MSEAGPLSEVAPHPLTVTLPAADPPPRAKAAPKEPVRTVNLPPDLRVLVVDDNHDVAESTAVLLRLEGCEVHLAYDGEEALRLVQQLHPTAVLLDIGLPRIDGFEVAARIRAEPEHRGILIVGVSGYGQEEYRLRSKQAGFDYHIVKPIEPSVLTGLLASMRATHTGAASDNVVSFPQRKTAE